MYVLNVRYCEYYVILMLYTYTNTSNCFLFIKDVN